MLGKSPRFSLRAVQKAQTRCKWAGQRPELLTGAVPRSEMVVWTVAGTDYAEHVVRPAGDPDVLHATCIACHVHHQL